jgi:glycosyltransferase involved in cell wall biosynthesis
MGKKIILFVHHVSVVGGASYCLLSIIKELDREKFHPKVLLRDDGPLVGELQKLNVEVLFCSSLWFYPYDQSLFKLRSIITIFNLYRSLQDFERVVDICFPDIVYFNNTFLFPYLSVTKKKGIKSIIHIREHWSADRHQRQFGYVQKQILDKADRIIAINEFSAKMISSDSNKVSIVYDWIDLDKRYKPLPMSDVLGEDASNLKVYIYTGGMLRIKGAYEVLKTFSEKVSDNDSRLLVLGFTKDFSSRGLKGIIKKVLLYLGKPTYDYLVKTVAKKDSRIVCVPSEYYIKDLFDQSYCMLSFFTIPHANLAMAEAMIEGLPVIAAKTEESLEYSQNGKLAMLFDLNDITGFEKCLSNLKFRYHDIKQELSMHKTELKDKFSREQNSKRLMSIMEML